MTYISPEFIQAANDAHEVTGTQKFIGLAILTSMYIGARAFVTVNRIENRAARPKLDNEEVNLQFIAQQETRRYDHEQFVALENLLSRLRTEEQ